jgi:hypothetical protein
LLSEGIGVELYAVWSVECSGVKILSSKSDKEKYIFRIFENKETRNVLSPKVDIPHL